MVYLLECLQKTPPPVSAASQAGRGAACRGSVTEGTQESAPVTRVGFFWTGAHLCREESRCGRHP